jgi:iron complex transport system permease protein
LIAFTLFSFFLSICVGAQPLGLGEVWSALFREGDGLNRTIVWNIRFPRALVGALAGACLAVSGVVLQGIMRNPLASPGTIGVNSGAGLAAALCLVLFPHMEPLLTPAAFLGAFGTTILIYALSWKNGVSPLRMVLAGMAVSSFVSAVINAIHLFFPERIQNTLNFSVGSLAAKGWRDFFTLLPYAAGGIALAFLFAQKLNLLALGDETAAGLGLPVERVRFFFIAVSSLLSAGAVAVVGLLGFVGLIVPHGMRLLTGSDHRLLFPASALAGASFVMVCDCFSRLVIRPAEMPVGIVIALMGAPFFLYLLRERMDANA